MVKQRPQDHIKWKRLNKLGNTEKHDNYLKEKVL